MTTRIADDYEYIKARMEQIAKERAEPSQHDPVAVEQYLSGGNSQCATLKASDLPYLGWDIYPPVVL